MPENNNSNKPQQYPQQHPSQQPSREHKTYNYGKKTQPDGRATSSGTANPPPRK